jgi:acetoin:2,6-dichlorophenolindophenol oxidoreductase subunit alpha
MFGKLENLYKKMFLIRKSEEVIIENYFDNEMKTPMHMSMGAEAISAGVCEAINEADQVFGTYRSHALYLAKTNDVKGFFAEMCGKKSGCCEGKSGSMHLCNIDKGYISSSAIVCSNIPVAVGAAFANKMKNNGKKVVVFFGDGAIEEGNFWESINMASLWSLPILFVCEDNNLAVNTSSEKRRGFNSIKDVVENFDFISLEGPGYDAQYVCDLATLILNKMEKLERPGFIKLEYYRQLEHVGVNSDAHEEYRKKDNERFCSDIDPINYMRKRLNVCDTDIKGIEEEITKSVYEALENAKQSDFSPISDLYKDVYYG